MQHLTPDVNIGIAFLAGVLSFLSPCALPLVPSYLSYITGLVYDQLVDETARSAYRRRIIIHSCLFILGFSIAFVSLGFSFSLAGMLLAKYQYWIKKVGGLLIIFFGLFIVLSLKIPFLMQDHMVNLKTKPAGYVGSLLVGLVFAVGWTPCVGPILGSILLIAGTQQELHRALVLMISYSLGLGLPFFLCALAMNRFFITFTRLRRFIPAVTTGSGILLMLIGVLMFIDKLQEISYILLKWLPSLEI
jgi:cytochrome c-type biogenesis protein